MFSKKDEDFLESLPLNVRFQTHASAGKKRRKRKRERRNKD